MPKPTTDERNRATYEAFDKAFASISASAIIAAGEARGRVIFRTSTSGLRVTCYLQIWGFGMQRGYAGGGGYDRRTAAFEDALRKIDDESSDPVAQEYRNKIRDAFRAGRNGRRWWDHLEDAGFTVANVID